jgi:hypothetical protein
MCYSVSSSFGTFFLVFFICCILWIRGSKVQKSLSIMLGIIAFMQVVEGFLWLNIECNNINKFITYFIPVLLFIQPIVVIGTLYTFDSGLLSPLFYKILLGISILSLPLYIDWFKDGIGKCTKIGQNGHLVWPFTNTNPNALAQVIYNILLGVGFTTLNTKWYGIFYVIMAALGYFKSKITYGHSWGSIWCHYVNLLSIGALLV